MDSAKNSAKDVGQLISKQDESLIDFKTIIDTMLRRAGVFLAVFLLTFSFVVLVTLQATPQYTATASVMIDPREKDVSGLEAVLSGLPPDSAAVDTEVEIIRSRSLSEKVVTDQNLVEDPEFNEDLRIKLY